ncbi:hypothetical protein BH09BAC2_BH09BAC2_18090 [soil metagenome]
MIFLTIGSQEPFDRIIEAIDTIAPELNMPVIAQVFDCKYRVKNIKTVEFISPVEYNNYIRDADLIVAHAGMGTILSALQLNKPLLVMPRHAKYHETRSDHQIETAKMFEKLNYIYVAYDTEELKRKIMELKAKNFPPLHQIGPFASTELVSSLKNYFTDEKKTEKKQTL